MGPSVALEQEEAKHSPPLVFCPVDRSSNQKEKREITRGFIGYPLPMFLPENLAPVFKEWYSLVANLFDAGVAE